MEQGTTTDFLLYKSKRGVTMLANHSYYMELLTGRAKRLNELLAMAAPTDMICREVRLLTEAAQPLEPQVFKSWKKETHESEEYQTASRCATG